MSGMRIWFGTAGSELIGATGDGTPVLGDEEGVEEMVEITQFFHQHTRLCDPATGVCDTSQDDEARE